MKTIIKYNNRKLYDRETSKYITITELLSLPLGSFRVILHGPLKFDVTTSTLLSSLTKESVDSEVKIQVMEYCINELQLGAL